VLLEVVVWYARCACVGNVEGQEESGSIVGRVIEGYAKLRGDLHVIADE
jgi:hypothetical protein